jgi:hypothetical protein
LSDANEQKRANDQIAIGLRYAMFCLTGTRSLLIKPERNCLLRRR